MIRAYEALIPATRPAPPSLGREVNSSRNRISTTVSGSEMANAFLSIAYACISLRKNAVAEINYQVKSSVTGGEVAEWHWASKLLNNPNDQLTRSQFFGLVSQYYDVTGNAFIWTPYIDHHTGTQYEYPRNMWVLNTSRLTIYSDETGITGYRYLTPGGSYIFIDPREVFSFRDLQASNRTDAMIWGIGKAKAARALLQADQKTLEYVTKYLDENFTPPLVLKSKEQMDDEQFKIWEAHWNSMMPGAHVAALIEGDMDVMPLPLGTEQAKQGILNGTFTDHNIKMICAVFGTPAALVIGEINNNALTGIAADGLNDFFVRYHLAHDVRYFCEELTRHFSKFEAGLSVTHEKFATHDPELSIKQAQFRITYGISTPNQEAELLGLPVSEFGNTPLIGNHLLSLANVVAPATTTVPGEKLTDPVPATQPAASAPAKALPQASPRAGTPGGNANIGYTPTGFVKRKRIRLTAFERAIKSSGYAKRLLNDELTVPELELYHKAFTDKMKSGEVLLFDALQKPMQELQEAVVSSVETKGLKVSVQAQDGTWSRRNVRGTNKHAKPIALKVTKDGNVSGLLMNLPFWEKRFAQVMEPEVLKVFMASLQTAIATVGQDYNALRSRFDGIIQSSLAKSTSKITTAVGTIKADLERLLASVADKPVTEIREAVKAQFAEVYKQSSAQRIAQTTSTYTTGTAQSEAFKELGYDSLWLHTGAGDTDRPAHVAANGQKKENGVYQVGGESIEHPGDGSAFNAINCHCVQRPRAKK